jgi:hypothetical protein
VTLPGLLNLRVPGGMCCVHFKPFPHPQSLVSSREIWDRFSWFYLEKKNWRHYSLWGLAWAQIKAINTHTFDFCHFTSFCVNS